MLFNVVRWHSEWILSGCIGMLLKPCPMFIKFIYNVWVCQYHCFAWSYLLDLVLSWSYINLNPYWGFILGTRKTFESCVIFWCFQAVKNRALVRYGLRTYLMLLSHCKPICYFLPPKNFRKLYSFLKIGGKK